METDSSDISSRAAGQWTQQPLIMLSFVCVCVCVCPGQGVFIIWFMKSATIGPAVL